MNISDDIDQINRKELEYIESHEVDLEKEKKLIEGDTTVGDSIKMYYREISKYPLLNKEKEIENALLTNNPSEKKLLKAKIIYVVNKKTGKKKPVDPIVYNLNIPLLFNSLCNGSSYQDIIMKILNSYTKLNSKVADEDILFKYLQETKRLKRALNKQELDKLFNIKTDKKLSEFELSEAVDEYINYRIGFDNLLVSNLRLVISNAVRYSHICTLDLNDLINEGNMGLISAINRYDVSLGFKFSTYAVCRIRQPIRKAISRYGTVIRLPYGLREELIMFKKILNFLSQERGREVTTEEVIDYLSNEEIKKIEETEKRKLTQNEKETIHIKKNALVNKYYEYLLEPLYIDQTISSEDDFTFGDLIPSPVSVEDIVMQRVLKDEIQILFSILTPREITAVKMLWGVCEYGGASFTKEEIGKVLHTTPFGVDQIIDKARKKMIEFVKRNEKVKALRIYN